MCRMFRYTTSHRIFLLRCAVYIVFNHKSNHLIVNVLYINVFNVQLNLKVLDGI